MLSQFSFRRVTNQRESDGSRNVPVKVRKRLRKTTTKFIFFGATVASISRTGDSSGGSIGELKAKLKGSCGRGTKPAKGLGRRPTTDDRRPTTNDAVKKEMRSGPATRTAFAMRESRRCPSPRAPADFLETFCNASRKSTLMLRRSFYTEVQLHPNRADRSQSRHARPFLRRPQRPGRPQRFHALGTFSSLSFDSAHANPKATAAEPALRDHWQRDIHACSDCTF
jgi:hypothetical protein